MIKNFIKNLPILGKFATRAYHRAIRKKASKPRNFPGSLSYWEQRYAGGGNSGAGSYDKFAQFKAGILNAFVRKNNIHSVIEFGSGDGNQLSLAMYPKYIGFDVSRTAIQRCIQQFSEDSSKVFKLVDEYRGETADLAISLDVIFHLVEDQVQTNYMQRLFNSSTKHVIIYSSNHENNAEYNNTHVKHRNFSEWIKRNASQWKLIEHIPNIYPHTGDCKTGSFADFYIYSIN